LLLALRSLSMDQLLSSKLAFPKLREKLVPRQRLQSKLSDGLDGKLTLISAPAGFGKTTMLSEWVGGQDQRVAWLSLDPAEDDPVRFLTYLIASLQTIDPAIGAGSIDLLRSPQQPPIKSILAALINEVGEQAKTFRLVLDDAHRVEARPVYELIQYLIEHLPANLHIALSGRVDPPLPLAHLRAQGQLMEIRVEDLRFSSAETTALLNDLQQLALSESELAALHSRTEGWIAGLQLAALSLEGRDDKAEFIKSFTGSHHFIIDFLVEEVMSRQDQDSQQFLIRTSVLDRFCAPLCDAMLNTSDSRQMLLSLERANLFLVPLDDDRLWYRYHHLFAEFLRQRLREQEPESATELHRAASRWLSQNGLTEEAAEHGLSADDPDFAIDLVERLAEEYWQRGEPTTLLKWLSSLPLEHVRDRPDLAIHSAWVLFLNGRNGEALDMLEGAADALGVDLTSLQVDSADRSARISEHDSREQLARIAAIRSAIAFRQWDVSSIFDYSQQAIQLLADRNSIWGSIAATNLGMAQDLAGDTTAACETLSKAVDYSRASGNTYMILSSSLHLATLLLRRGQLHRVYDLCHELMLLAEERGVLQSEMAGCMYDELGLVLCEWNRLEESIEHLRRGAALSQQGFDTGVLGWSYLSMIRAQFAQGELDGAQELIRKMDRLELESDVPLWFSSPKEAWKARVLLARGELRAAARWAVDQGLKTDGEVTYAREEEHIAFARILFSTGRLEEAQDLLGRLINLAEQGGRIDSLAQCKLVLAMIHQRKGDVAAALATVSQAIALTEPGGFIRLYLDEGEGMAKLLRMAAARHPSSAKFWACWPPSYPGRGSLDSSLFRRTPCEPIPKTSTASSTSIIGDRRLP
jgi:LuxR family maltose regulon positive regulatory protein